MKQKGRDLLVLAVVLSIARLSVVRHEYTQPVEPGAHPDPFAGQIEPFEAPLHHLRHLLRLWTSAAHRPQQRLVLVVRDPVAEPDEVCLLRADLPRVRDGLREAEVGSRLVLATWGY